MKELIEDADGGVGTAYTLINEKGKYPVVGTFGDIASLVDPMTGVPIQGRTIEATVTMQTITAAAGEIPARGWRVCIKGIDGQDLFLYVQRNEPDRTIGLCRLTLGIHLEDNEDGE
jgi:hypothetical protein